jgi:hypothetical protein
MPGTYPCGINIDPSDIAPRPDQIAPMQVLKKQTEWFTPASFADAIGHFGNSTNGNLLGPGIELWDLSAIKNINISEPLSLSVSWRVLERLQPHQLRRWDCQLRLWVSGTGYFDQRSAPDPTRRQALFPGCKSRKFVNP